MSRWPSHAQKVVPWRSRGARGSREDRELREITASIPPYIATLPYDPPPTVSPLLERGVQDIARLDAEGRNLAPLGRFLIRTESVSSSKIEYIEASIEDFARAMGGVRANPSATSMVDGVTAITRMVDDAGREGRITLGSILAAHHALLREDPLDGPHAGRLRDMQNWIEGSDYSPIGAVHVPPPPELVPDLMADVVEFANRDDVPVLAQSAIAHAQFESIHPFTDGNGRIGRAFINAIIRRRGVTTNTITPLASAMVADRAGYFRLINDYRAGDIDPFVENVARSASVASREAVISADRLRELPSSWRTRARARAGSAARAILDLLLEHPVVTANTLEDLTHRSTSSIYEAMDRLAADGIVGLLTDRKRNRIWGATEILDELDGLAVRIGQRVAEKLPDLDSNQEPID